MNRTNTATRPLNFLFNPVQAVLGRGGQINWARVSAFFSKGKFTVKLSAAAALGAEALAVDALEHPIKAGSQLDFGTVESVTVTLSGNEAIGQTDLGVTALTGPIPAGAVLEFGPGEFAKLSAPAIAGATSLTVDALEVAIESGDDAVYQGGNLVATVTEDADAAATALVVEPLQFAIADDAEALGDYTGTNDARFIPAGTFMARDADDMLIPRHDADAETATEILQSDARENSNYAAKSGYGTFIEAYVYENLLPDADTDGNIPSAYKTEAATNGGRFNYMDWNDDRTS